MLPPAWNACSVVVWHSSVPHSCQSQGGSQSRQHCHIAPLLDGRMRRTITGREKISSPCHSGVTPSSWMACRWQEYPLLPGKAILVLSRFYLALLGVRLPSHDRTRFVRTNENGCCKYNRWWTKTFTENGWEITKHPWYVCLRIRMLPLGVQRPWKKMVFTTDHYFSRDLQSTIPGDYYFNGLWLPGLLHH